MANVLDRNFDFATNGTVTAAGLHNLIDETNIYAGLISTQEERTSVGTADLLLIANSSSIGSPQIAANRTTVYNLFEDALTGGTYVNAQLSGNLTYGTASGGRTISTSANITNGTISTLIAGTTTSTAATITTGTIPTLTAGTTTGTAGIFTSGTVATLNSTTGTITNLSTTLAGDFTISQGTGTLGTTGATLGTYGGATSVPVLAINAKGQVTSTGTAAITSGLTGFRNRIINGDMRIDQRNAGASQSITAASPSYSVDRFIVRPIGATVTGQRVAGTGSTQYVYQLTGAASVTQLQFEQRIEASNSYDLAGGNATLSVNLSNSLLTTVNWILYYATATDNFASNTLISSGSWTVSSSIARYNATISIPAAATTGLYLIIYVGAQTSGTFKIGDVQLEAGSTATDFERRPIGTELMLCQRYYQKRVGDSYSTGVSGQAYGTATVYGSVSFIQEMRSSPNVSLTATGSAANTISFMNNLLAHPATMGTITANTISVNGFQMLGNGYTSGFTAGNASLLYRNGLGEIWNASAEL
jgi:hypothetical protein